MYEYLNNLTILVFIKIHGTCQYYVYVSVNIALTTIIMEADRMIRGK